MDTQTDLPDTVKPPTSVAIHLRIPAELAAKIEAAAAADHRSVASYTRLALMEKLMGRPA